MRTYTYILYSYIYTHTHIIYTCLVLCLCSYIIYIRHRKVGILYSNFRVYQFFLLIPRVLSLFFAMLLPRERNSVRVIRIDMFAYTCLHVKNIPIRMDAQRNALKIKKSL